MSDFNAFVTTLIQYTPHTDALIENLERKGFQGVRHRQSALVTQYLKTRRLYDTLFRFSAEYNDESKGTLKKCFTSSGNGYAGDLFFATILPPWLDSMTFWRSAAASQTKDQLHEFFHAKTTGSLEISSRDMFKIYSATKVGNVARMESLMATLAAKCVVMNIESVEEMNVDPENRLEFNSFIKPKLNLFRSQLQTILLQKRGWKRMTLLHAAVDVKSPEGVNLVLRYAHEAGVKSELLDAEDAFGNTALRLAVRKGDASKVKQLITEGADVFLANVKNQFPLQLICTKLPKIVLFLMDRAVTVSSDLCFFNIDFSVISTNTKSPEGGVNKLVNRKSLKAADNRKTFDEIPLNVIRIEDDGTENDSFLKSSTSTSKSLFTKEDEMQTLASLVYNDPKCAALLLQHPVTRLFLDLKWTRLSFIIYANSACRLFFYLIYFAVTFRIYFKDCPHRSVTQESRTCNWSPFTFWLLPVVLGCLGVYAGAEVCKIPAILRVSRFRKYWFGYLGMGAWTRFGFFVVAMATTVPPYYTTDLQSWQYPLATVGILLASILLMQVVGDSNISFGIHSIYVHVYARVLTRFLTVIVTFSGVLLGFAISFSIIFPQPREFSTFARSLFRLLIMIHGEFDFEHNSSLADLGEDAWVFWTGQVLYVLFGSIVTLVLIDVFLGYTISDIKELKDQAEDVRRFIQIQQMFVIENFLLGFKQELGKRFKVFENRPQFTVIPKKRLMKHRRDVMVSYDELDERFRSEFTDLVSQNG